MIKIKNLYFSYNHNSPYILNNINLNIKKGSYTSILGENGSGKTTLIKIILNLLTPIKGIIKINTNKIGYVPQKMESFNSEFPITVSEILNCHKKIIKLKEKNAINENLEMVGMKKFKNHLIGNLSGGQKQKIFIARALMGKPKLLILDEPSTGIDIQSQKEIYTILKKLNKNLGITILSIEHNLEAVINNSTHIYLMENGYGTLYPIDEYKYIKNQDFSQEVSNVRI